MGWDRSLFTLHKNSLLCKMIHWKLPLHINNISTGAFHLQKKLILNRTLGVNSMLYNGNVVGIFK